MSKRISESIDLFKLILNCSEISLIKNVISIKCDLKYIFDILKYPYSNDADILDSVSIISSILHPISSLLFNSATYNCELLTFEAELDESYIYN